MHRFKNILFVSDCGSAESAALECAIDLAEKNGARLTLMNALQAENLYFSAPKIISTANSSLDSLVWNRLDELERMAGTIIDAHPSISITVTAPVGSPATEVIRAVLVEKHDLVIKAAKGNMGKVRAILGNTDMEIMRKCPCPVWMLQGSGRKRGRRILAAVDMNTSEPEAASLAPIIMALATSIADREKSELHVVSAWRVANEAKLRGRQISARSVDTLVEEMRQAHQKELSTLLNSYPYSKRITHLLPGSPGKVIPKLVRELEIDLVVIGTVGRCGVPGFIIGNTAEKILTAVDCSLLAVKADGLRIPIEVFDRALEAEDRDLTVQRGPDSRRPNARGVQVAARARS